MIIRNVPIIYDQEKGNNWWRYCFLHDFLAAYCYLDIVAVIVWEGELSEFSISCRSEGRYVSVLY